MCKYLISRRNNKGLFLVEVLLTVALLSVGLTFIIRSYVSGLRASVYTTDYSMATILLENKMSDLIQRGFIEDGLREEQYFEKPYEKFKYELEVQNVEDNGGAGLDWLQLNQHRANQLLKKRLY